MVVQWRQYVPLWPCVGTQNTFLAHGFFSLFFVLRSGVCYSWCGAIVSIVRLARGNRLQRRREGRVYVHGLAFKVWGRGERVMHSERPFAENDNLPAGLWRFYHNVDSEAPNHFLVCLSVDIVARWLSRYCLSAPAGRSRKRRTVFYGAGFNHSLVTVPYWPSNEERVCFPYF